MKQPVNNYRYTVVNVLGTISSAAVFGEGDFTIDWTFQDSGAFDYSKTMPGKLIFRGAVYTNFLTIETTTTRCDFMTLTVERFCGGAWVPWFAGRFSLNDASWDLYRCEVEIKLDKFEDEACIEDNQTEEINLFDFVPNRQTVRPYSGNLVIEKVTYDAPLVASSIVDAVPVWLGAGTPAAGGWVMYYNYYGIYFNVVPTAVKSSKWARQVLTLPVADPSPGAEWILISTAGGFNKWAKPAPLYDCTDEDIQNQGFVALAHKTECKVLGDAGTLSFIDNGMKLADCLQAFVSKFCPGITLKSQFFQINPDTVTAINYVTGATSKVRNLVVFQKSDVKRPNVSGNATKAMISWEKFISNLSEMFNLKWRVTAGVLRVEHVSFYSKAAGLDLTAPRYSKYVLGLQKYNYKTEQIPKREEFKFMEASAGDFAGLPIEYTGGCVSQGKRQEATTHAADLFTTDVELCFNNASADSNVVADAGFVLIAATSGAEQLILGEPPILSAGTKLNNTLAWAQLQRDYHKHYRALKSGIMNGAPTTFASVKPLKKAVPLVVPFCCGDTFNPDDLVTTVLGAGSVEKATFSFIDEMLTLELVYPSDLNLYVPPVAVNDIFTINPEPTFLGVLANDVNSTTGGAITDIAIVSPPLHGIINITGGTLLEYVPNALFYGQDNFVYKVKDAAGIFSNNALVAINVLSGVYVRLETYAPQFENILQDCGAGNVLVGYRRLASYRLLFFSDAAGTIPMDTTGMALEIRVVQAGETGISHSPYHTEQDILAAGTSTVIFTDHIFYLEKNDCFGAPEDFINEAVSIGAGPYIII